MNMWRKAAEAWDRHLRRGVAGVLATAMAISLLPAASWAAWPIIPPVQITEDTKSQFPNIEFQTNFVRTEYGTRRVGRGRYVRDSSKKIYHYEYTLRLPDGHTIERKTNASDYITLRQGLHYPVELRQGALGWTVIR